MRLSSRSAGLALGLLTLFAAPGASAASFTFSTGLPDGLMAAASRPAGSGLEIETGDDFILSQATRINSASFTGLLAGNASVADIVGVGVEIYRVFPNDSGPASGNVPTRVNSPSDVAFDSRDSAGGSLSFTAGLIGSSFTAANSVLNGIHPLPGIFTGGEGPVTGSEVTFNVVFNTPFLLPGDHYFFVPQVQLSSGDFFWLSAPRPIVSPGTPFAPDLQAWIRNEDLAPDWLRIGTDITHQGPFNMTFTLNGSSVPEPATWALMIGGFGLAGLGLRRRRVRLAAAR